MPDQSKLQMPRRRRQSKSQRQTATTHVYGGRLTPLSSSDINSIVETAVDILATIGMSDTPQIVIDTITRLGGTLTKANRLTFPTAVTRETLARLDTALVLPARNPVQDINLSSTRVQTGTGGAAPMMLDLETSQYRPSTLCDLYDAARLTDQLANIHFFSRPVTARDMETSDLLAINTAYACLAGTSKHVMVAAETAEQVRAIARICHLIAGSKDTFQERPFLSLNINHAVPPLRFSEEAVEVLAEATRQGIPAHTNTFGQLGASSPVTIAGCIAQTLAETLAGMIFAHALNPKAKLICGTRPMVTDLRTGGMAGGAGEQALLTAAMMQVVSHLNLPNSTIAGATDAKVPDAQSGFEKALSVSMAAQTGAHMITQSCGMQAGLMGCSLEAYVTDNDMLGAILRSLVPIEVSNETLAQDTIHKVVHQDGHFLGEPATLARMQSDFLYPDVSDRQSPEEWQAAGSHDIRTRAKARARQILDTHYPNHIPEEIDAQIRAEFDIRLPRESMRPA